MWYKYAGSVTLIFRVLCIKLISQKFKKICSYGQCRELILSEEWQS